MKKIMSFIVAAGLMLFNPDAARAVNPEKLVIAIQPTASPQQLASRSGELEVFLEKRLGRDVEIFFPTNYAGVIEALRFGHAHAAFMGSWPAVMAQNRAGARVVLAEIREVIIDGELRQEPYYFSYWVVPRNSPYKALAELRGRKAAFPSQISSSGYVAPVSRLVELGLLEEKKGGVDPGTFFSEVIFAGGYAQAWEALKAGQVEVSVIAGDVPEALYRAVLDNTRVLETQGPIPSHVVVVSHDLDAAIARKLADALLELNSGEDRELMRKFVSGIFVRFEPATQAHLAPLQQMLNYTGFEFQDKGK